MPCTAHACSTDSPAEAGHPTQNIPISKKQAAAMESLEMMSPIIVSFVTVFIE